MNRDILNAKWQDYLFLTHEMKKFLMKQDLDLFFSLVEQRETLHAELEKISDTDYNTSVDGKKRLREIKIVNDEMMGQFHAVFNSMKKQRTVSRSYEGMVTFASNEYK